MLERVMWVNAQKSVRRNRNTLVHATPAATVWEFAAEVRELGSKQVQHGGLIIIHATPAPDSQCQRPWP